MNRRLSSWAIAAICIAAVVLCISILFGCAWQKSRPPASEDSATLGSPLQVALLLGLDQGDIDEAMTGFGFTGFTISTEDHTGEKPVVWETFAYSADGYDLADVDSLVGDAKNVYVRYGKGANTYGQEKEDVYHSAADLAGGPAPSSVVLTATFDLADAQAIDDVAENLFAATAEGAEELYTTNFAQNLADQQVELLAQMTDEERAMYYEYIEKAGIEDIAGRTFESTWTDQHWYRCEVHGKDALVLVSASGYRGYGDDYKDLVASGGNRYQLHGYCVYLTVLAEYLGIDPSYDAFVEYVKENGLISLQLAGQGSC